jgi:hypothetical protein
MKCSGALIARLVSDRVHDAAHVFRTMINLAHQEVLPFLALLAFSDLLDGADEARASPLTPGALETSKPTHLHPADFAISPLNPVLPRGAPWIGGIERCLDQKEAPTSLLRGVGARGSVADQTRRGDTKRGPDQV